MYISRVVELSNITIGELISEVLSTPSVSMVVVIQFLLGVALGYIATKIFKYVLAMIGILVLGSLLSIWSIEGLSKETLGKLGATIETIKNIVISFTALLVGPIATGFILGVVIGLIRE